jgi:hypothetical protein
MGDPILRQTSASAGRGPDGVAGSAGEPQSSEAAAFIARVRRLMLVTFAATFVALSAVLGLVGYRLFAAGKGAVSIDADVALPRGAKVTGTAVDHGHIIVTLDLGGTVEIRSYDLTTLKPAGRLRFTPAP